MSDLPAYIGRYRVVEQLSRGGMGLLYLARDPAIDRTVAIKVAQVHNVELRQRFLREARATGRLNHRNIVTIFDVGEHEGEPFMAMEYVPGRTLGEIVRQNTPLPLLERLRLMRELADGLAFAHDEGIVHRDVKPANLIVRDDTGVLTILDFGIARMTAGHTTTGAGQTVPGTVLGTPNYMAPEQIEGRPVDHRSDIFAVGVVFYELLSYRRAFAGDSPSAAAYQIVHEEPTPLPELISDLDGGLIAIVARALKKRADERYQHLSELIADLDAAVARIKGEDSAPEATILLRPDDRTLARPSTGSGTATSRETLMARREKQLAAHLAAANAALDKGRYDTAQGAADQAALLDLDDRRVAQMFERIAACRLAAQVEEHLANARGYLKDLALTKASESIDLALQTQPESPEGLRLRQDIETRRAINDGLEEAEQRLAAGEFAEAMRSVEQVLAIEPAHAASLQLKDRIGSAEHDHRARTAVDEARRKRAAGELAAAQQILEGVDGPHELVEAELASVRRELRESFEAIAGKVREGLEHGNLQDAQAQMHRALEALGAGRDPEPPDPRQQAATPPSAPTGTLALRSPVGAPESAAPAPPNGERRGRTTRMVGLGAAAAVIVIVVSGGVWLASSIFGGEAPGVPGNRASTGGTGDGGRAAAAPASQLPVPPPAEIDPAPDEDGAGTAPESPVEPAPPPARRSSPAPRSSPSARPPASRSSPPASLPRAPAAGPDVDRLLADAVAAEAGGDLETARDRYADVLRRDAGNRTAQTGSQRVQAAITQTAAQEHLRGGDAAFAAGQYDEARRLFQEASDLGAPEAAEKLQRVDGALAVVCGDDTNCGTLVVRVEPAAEILVDGRSMGTASDLALRLPAGRHRIRLETDAWRFPQVVEVAAGATRNMDVNLEQDGFPR